MLTAVMANLNKTFLTTLLSTPGPSSFEAKAARVWREQGESYGADVRSDVYGNTFATFGSAGKPRIMLAGHIDEIGLIVTYIDGEGLIYFKGIGGWDAQQLIGQRVRILGYGGEVPGVIGKMPVHLMSDDDRKKVPKMKDMWLDIGAKNGDEAKKYVRPGDAAVIEQPFLELLNGRVVSKAIDNRIGAYVVLEAARRAAEKGASAEVVAVATVQEEIGGVGAYIASHELRPDVAVAVDVTHATDVPGVDKKQEGDVTFGCGPVLSVGSYVQRGVLNALVETAEAEGIPYRLEPAPRNTYTDADDIAKNRGGVPTAVVSVPNRYMHSPNEMIDLGDLEQVIRLIAAFIEKLDEETTFAQL